MNLPNALTVLRIVFVPVFSILFLRGQFIPALIVYVAAALTDALDGYLARKWSQVTTFGKLADPLADKLMQCAMLFCLAYRGYVAPLVPIALLIKELYMVIGAALLYKRDVTVYALSYGKIATVLLIVSIVLIYPWHSVEPLAQFGGILIYIGLAVSLLSAVLYTVGAIRQLRMQKT